MKRRGYRGEFCEKSEKDNRPKTLRLRGGYLYDKGENDEHFYVGGCPQPIYKYIITRTKRKVKKKLKKIFFDEKV